ncbi:MAG: hypothetical protein AMXMBFR7_14520 [Planctomycetota bacterium]
MQPERKLESEHAFVPLPGYAVAIRQRENLVIIEPSPETGYYWVSGFTEGNAFYGRVPVAAADLKRELRQSAPFAFGPRCEVCTFKCEPPARSWMERSLPEGERS